jgi:hypothetical protein
LEYELRSNTRGRGDNPTTGKRGTRGSNTLLNFSIKEGKKLNLKELKTNYQPYFGYIQNLLYSSPPLDILNPTVGLMNKPKPCILTKMKRTSKTNSSLKLTTHNISSKIIELYLMKVTNQVPLDWKIANTNIERELELPGTATSLEEIPNFGNPLKEMNQPLNPE